jgi:signal transduction histidine kinase
MENNLLRIGQEAITNSLKYAGAGRIRIGVDYQPRSIVLRIHDDGQGFDPLCLAITEGAHFGLLGMRERAKQMGAELSVKSRPGEGTEVLVKAPLG